jgi:tetratricopeptide (TPR) repeat protein
LELDPSAAGHDTLAYACYRLGQVEDVLEHYTAALGLDPFQVETYERRGRGNGHGEIGNSEAALADYQQCLTLAPGAEDRDQVEAIMQAL